MVERSSLHSISGSEPGCKIEWKIHNNIYINYWDIYNCLACNKTKIIFPTRSGAWNFREHMILGFYWNVREWHSDISLIYILLATILKSLIHSFISDYTMLQIRRFYTIFVVQFYIKLYRIHFYCKHPLEWKWEFMNFWSKFMFSNDTI